MPTLTHPTPSVNILRSATSAHGITASVQASNGSSAYRTTVQSNGTTTCTCKGHHYRGYCKHVTAVKAQRSHANAAKLTADLAKANDLLFGF